MPTKLSVIKKDVSLMRHLFDKRLKITEHLDVEVLLHVVQWLDVFGIVQPN